MKDIEGIFNVAERIAELKKKADRPDQKPRRARAPRNFKHLDKFPNDDIVGRLQHHLNQADMLHKVLEDRGKATKKEDKKDDKKKLSLEQIVIMLVGSYPIIGLLLWYSMR
jgi:hypothetical protein